MSWWFSWIGSGMAGIVWLWYSWKLVVAEKQPQKLHLKTAKGGNDCKLHTVWQESYPGTYQGKFTLLGTLKQSLLMLFSSSVLYNCNSCVSYNCSLLCWQIIFHLTLIALRRNHNIAPITPSKFEKWENNNHDSAWLVTAWLPANTKCLGHTGLNLISHFEKLGCTWMHTSQFNIPLQPACGRTPHLAAFLHALTVALGILYTDRDAQLQIWLPSWLSDYWQC